MGFEKSKRQEVREKNALLKAKLEGCENKEKQPKVLKFINAFLKSATRTIDRMTK